MPRTSVRTELKRFLISDIFSAIGLKFKLESRGNVYFGRDARVEAKDREVFLRWVGRHIQDNNSGRLISNSLEITLMAKRYDLVETTGFQGLIEDASRTIVERYDNNPGQFMDAIDEAVNRVRCAEMTEIEISPLIGGRWVEAQQTIGLVVDTWEFEEAT
jgi:hypothetical protein